MNTPAAMRKRIERKGAGVERRAHRRHDLQQQAIPVERWDVRSKAGVVVGELMDMSSGGMRIRTQTPVRADQQIRLRLKLPTYAGISPFIDTATGAAKPKTEWIGWMAVCRVAKVDDKHYDLGGRLIEMDDLDRGMLGLYLSTQPLAA
ncbi:MAG TPA: PilZ domain-containing protein [Tepidisphaeraceae bacterium]|jgi:hypothetical protein|nr:PilZ domain-containing protein [Tepidisphaeraceae bacterium]